MHLVCSACGYRGVLVNICPEICLGTRQELYSLSKAKECAHVWVVLPSAENAGAEQAFLPYPISNLWSSSVILRSQWVPKREELELDWPKAPEFLMAFSRRAGPRCLTIQLAFEIDRDSIVYILNMKENRKTNVLPSVGVISMLTSFPLHKALTTHTLPGAGDRDQ